MNEAEISTIIQENKSLRHYAVNVIMANSLVKVERKIRDDYCKPKWKALWEEHRENHLKCAKANYPDLEILGWIEEGTTEQSLENDWEEHQSNAFMALEGINGETSRWTTELKGVHEEFWADVTARNKMSSNGRCPLQSARQILFESVEEMFREIGNLMPNFDIDAQYWLEGVEKPENCVLSECSDLAFNKKEYCVDIACKAILNHPDNKEYFSKELPLEIESMTQS